MWAIVLLGLTAAPVFPLCAQTWNYPVGYFHAAGPGWNLPPGLAKSWVEQGSYLAGAQLRQIAGARSQSLARRSLAALALATGEISRKQFDTAQKDLLLAARWAPIRAVAASELAQLRWQNQDWQGVLQVEQQFATALRQSPFGMSVAQVALQSAARLKDWAAVLRLAPLVPESPARLALEQQAWAARKRSREEARVLGVLERRYPASAQARAAEPGWRALLLRYPTMAPNWRDMQEQAQGWGRAGQSRMAAETLQRAIAHAPRSQRDLLRMQLARAWVEAGDAPQAEAALRPLLHGPLRAEALEVDLQRARVAGDMGQVEQDVRLLRREAPHSSWYRRALWDAGNAATLENDLLLAQAHYDMVAKSFPDSPGASTAAWRATWQSYRLDQTDAGERLDGFLRAYPRSPEAADALYWRGRWAQRGGDAAAARQYYLADATRFPGSYFGMQAAERLEAMGAGKAASGPLARTMLHRLPDFSPADPRPLTPAERRASRLAGALASAWALKPAAIVLQRALASARRPSLPLARQLMSIDQQRQSWAGGIVAMERALPGYLGYNWNQLPRAEWQALFPYPYRPLILQSARHWGVAPDLILGLMRQESAFNPQSFSSAHARGLMQLLYSTALIHARALGWRNLTPNDLFLPQVNIPLGVSELNSLLVQFHGVPAYALAAYNAGGSRVDQWLNEGPYRSINEFIESIPFHETRGYVQAVLRNQAHYRHLY